MCEDSREKDRGAKSLEMRERGRRARIKAGEGGGGERKPNVHCSLHACTCIVRQHNCVCSFVACIVHIICSPKQLVSLLLSRFVILNHPFAPFFNNYMYFLHVQNKTCL